LRSNFNVVGALKFVKQISYAPLYDRQLKIKTAEVQNAGVVAGENGTIAVLWQTKLQTKNQIR
jgi:hypothetical protein